MWPVTEWSLPETVQSAVRATRQRSARCQMLRALLLPGFFLPAVILQIAILPNYSQAQGNPRDDQVQSTSRLLADQKQKIDKEEARLRSLRKQQTTIQADAAKAERGLALVKKAQDSLQVEVDKLEVETAERSQAVDAAKAQFDKSAVQLRQRLVAMYKTQHRNASLTFVFQSSSATEMLKRVNYLGRIASFDKAYIEELTGVIERLESDRQQLSEVKSKRQEKFDQLAKAQTELEGRRLKQASLLRESREQEKQIQRSLTKLQSSAKNMEAVIASLTGQDGPVVVEEVVDDTPVEPIREPTPEPVVPQKTPTPKPTPPQVKVVKTVVESSAQEGTSEYDGPGLGGLKGKLKFPVQGKVIQHFGKQRHEEFADILFIKGVEMSAADGAEVRAVASGKVVLNKVLPGYGKVVILDHGKRYYTLYGRLAKGTREVGDVVQAGDIVAELGAPDHRGRNFYFELRIRGKASDPAEYFANMPKVVAE